MKAIKLTLSFMTIACVFLSCKKESDDDGSDCQNDNTTKVTFANTGSTPLRVVVATSLTPQFTPINPILSLDLAPGATSTKEFKADQYFNVWYRDCSTICSLITYYQKTYAVCSAYDEKQGI